jgi:hypothetical protein
MSDPFSSISIGLMCAEFTQQIVFLPISAIFRKSGQNDVSLQTIGHSTDFETVRKI